GKNTIVITADGDDRLQYQIFTASARGLSASGEIREGESVETGWMGLKFQVLRHLPRAQNKVTFIPRDTPSKVTLSALELEFEGQRHWMGVNSVMRLFSDENMYLVSWGNRRIDLGFNMRLDDFRIGHYQGTRR